MPKLSFKLLALLSFLVFQISCRQVRHNEYPVIVGSKVINVENGKFRAFEISEDIIIDGKDDDQAWQELPWYGMNYNWMGDFYAATDYKGKFKLAWDKNKLYILAHIVDDVLHPTLQDGIENYWKGDYIEVFIDENQSGGDHKFNHQAFAYHISTEGHAIDKSTTEETVFFDDHIDVNRTKIGNTYIWEIAVSLYDDSFNENDENKPIEIVKGKKIGFSIAYGDNDGNAARENFVGSKKTHGVNNDEGYTNSSVFGELTFD